MAPRPYSQTHPTLRADILARVAAGETLTAICREPGMPSYASLYAWSRADPAFGAALAAARRRGDWRRRYAFDEPTARALLARLAAGEPITAILRDPAMPSRGVYRYWRATQAHFQEEVHRLNRVHVRERTRRHLRPYRCWDQALADRILVRVAGGETLQGLRRADPALPCRQVLTRWRREQPPFDRLLRIAIGFGQRLRGYAAAGGTPELTEVIVDEIREGASLASLGREPDMPSAATLYDWVRTRPDFAREVAQACDDRVHWYTDQMLLIAEACGPASVKATRARTARLARQLARLQHRPGGRWET